MIKRLKERAVSIVHKIEPASGKYFCLKLWMDYMLDI